MDVFFSDAEMSSELSPDELLAQIDPYDLLEDDPDELDKQELAEELIEIRDSITLEAPVLRDLIAAGYPVKSLCYFGAVRGVSKSLDDAVPILLHHLRMDHPVALKELIVTRFHDVRFVETWEPLREEFMKADKNSYLAEALAFAMAQAASVARLDEMIDLVKDKSNGSTRIAFLRPLWRTRREVARRVVEEAVNDPELRAEADAILRGRSPNDD